jgi:hypothetical protein
MAYSVVKQFVEAQIIGAAVLYEAPATAIGVIQAANIYNPTGASVQIQVAITGNGVAVGGANTFINELIPTLKSYLCPEIINQRVTPGHQIKVTGGAGLNIAIGGVEISNQ